MSGFITRKINSVVNEQLKEFIDQKIIDTLEILLYKLTTPGTLQELLITGEQVTMVSVSAHVLAGYSVVNQWNHGTKKCSVGHDTFFFPGTGYFPFTRKVYSFKGVCMGYSAA